MTPMAIPTNLLPLNDACRICSSTTRLLRYTGYNVVHYCSREQQSSHWPRHKGACKRIRDDVYVTRILSDNTAKAYCDIGTRRAVEEELKIEITMKQYNSHGAMADAQA